MQDRYEKLLDSLLAMTDETEVVEFKKASDHFDYDKTGAYYSALSNEANLHGLECGWLVFGIDNKTHAAIGTSFLKDIRKQNELKKNLGEHLSMNMNLHDIIEVSKDGKRVVMLKIPAAPAGIPVAYKRACYGRDGESLVPLSLDKIERIRSQKKEDWSAGIVDAASFDDLDPVAIAAAREGYRRRYPNRAEELNGWDDRTFLNKAKLTIKGRITKTALLLLGRDEASVLIDSRIDPKIRLLIKDERGDTTDYCICTTPFILSIETIANKVPNSTYQYLRDNSLIAETVTKFDPFIIREALCNCIGHQDYMAGWRIDIIARGDHLTLINAGSFIPESVEKVVIQDAPEPDYRNKFLVEAMTNIGLVETVGGGIRKMFAIQQNKGFPLPDYNLSDNKVEVVITGKVVDKDFADILMRNTDLPIEDVLILDKVSKKKRLSKDEADRLRKKNLVEGRYPNLFISKNVASVLGKKVEYTRLSGLDIGYYKALIIKALSQYGELSKQDIRDLLFDKLPDNLSDKAKSYRIDNLLRTLRQEGRISNETHGSNSVWRLVSNQEEIKR